jgi:hypothetical protein
LLPLLLLPSDKAATAHHRPLTQPFVRLTHAPRHTHHDKTWRSAAQHGTARHGTTQAHHTWNACACAT